jgi:RNA polymerase sigma-B factor
VTPASETEQTSTENERRALLREYREDGNLAARDRLVEELLPVVRSIARRYAGRGEETEDLMQIASVGLVKAIENFDLDRDVRILAYVLPTVVGELKRYFRDHAWAVKVPRRLKELNQFLTRQLDDLTADLGRSPTIAELAAGAGISEEEVVEALEASRAYSTRSLSATFDDGEEGELESEALRTEETGYAVSEDRALLAKGLRALDARERRIIHLRFFEGRTQSQIATDLKISQMHVSRLLRRAMETLESELTEANGA